MVDKTEIIARSLATNQLPSFIEGKLKQHLPFSLPFYRRCQFHLRNVLRGESQAQSGEIWVVIGRPNSITPAASQVPVQTWLESWLDGSNTPSRTDLSNLAAKSNNSEANVTDQPQWLAAHIDLSHAGETQVWLFASWESEQQLPSGPDPSTSQSKQATRSTLFTTLYNHIRKKHVPSVSDRPTKRWQTLRDTGKIVSEPYKRSKVLFGGVSEVLGRYFENDVVYGPDVRVQATTTTDSDQAHSCRSRQDIGYLKYIIPPLTSKEPPPGLSYGELSTSHLQLMLDRTAIPRTLETLQSLVSIGLFTKENSTAGPIAWGLLGKDASLSSLHTESEYRGRGLAEYICRHLGTLQDSNFRSDWLAEDGDVGVNTRSESNEVDYSSYLHADVSESNAASQRVCEKLGGKVRWKVAWIEVDVGETSIHMT